MQQAPEREERFRILLQQERDRVLRLRNELNDSWRLLQRPERWVEDEAQEQNISRGIEDLDTIEKGRMEDVDHALKKLNTGSFGFCENCGVPIDDARLEVLPWTPWCISCSAGRKEQGRVASAQLGGRNLDPDYDGMSCEERQELIADEFRVDGRVDTQELEVECNDRTVVLRGFLPSEEEHQILLQILEDRLGLREIVDEIGINRQLWEREERASGLVEDEKAAQDWTLLQGEIEKEEIQESLGEGTTTLAPDELIPEN